MLSCREVTERASALIDRELSWSERLQMRIHLAMCRHCSRFVSQLRLLRAALRQRARASDAELHSEQVQRIIDGLPLPPGERPPD
jgi:anti-sigma factor RsiW